MEEDEWIEEEEEDEGRSKRRRDYDLALPSRAKRTPDKSLKHLAYFVLRSRHSIDKDGGDPSYFVITPEFCKEVVCARRRIYDVCNVLEGIGMFSRLPGVIRTYKVIGIEGVQRFIERILLDGIKALPSTFNRSTKYVREDFPTKKKKKKRAKDNLGRRRKPKRLCPPMPPPHEPPPWIEPNESGRDRLKNMTRSMLYALVMKLYRSRDGTWAKRDFVEWLAVQHGGSAEHMQYQTVHRRAYDVLNVFEVVGLIRFANEYSRRYVFCEQLRDQFPDQYQLKLAVAEPQNDIRIPESGEEQEIPEIPHIVQQQKTARKSERIAVKREDVIFKVPEIPRLVQQQKRKSERIAEAKKIPEVPPRFEQTTSNTTAGKKISVGPPRISLVCHELWDYPIPPPPPLMLMSGGEQEDGTDSNSGSDIIDMFAPTFVVPFRWEELEIN